MRGSVRGVGADCSGLDQTPPPAGGNGVRPIGYRWRCQVIDLASLGRNSGIARNEPRNLKLLLNFCLRISGLLTRQHL